MDRLFDISLGKGHELLLALQRAGLTAEQALQLIKEPKTTRRLVTTLTYPWSHSMPMWWRTPDEQIVRAREIWGEDIEIPELPANFVPRAPTEVLLLHVPRPIREMWKAITAPSGFGKNGGWDWVFDERFHLLSGVLNHEKPVWVGFDWNFPLEKTPKNKLPIRPNFPSGCYLAAGEVMSAAIQFTGWISTWGKWNEDRQSHYAPDMAGYSIDYSGDHEYGKTSIVALRSRDYPVKRINFRIVPASLGVNAALVRTL